MRPSLRALLASSIAALTAAVLVQNAVGVTGASASSSNGVSNESANQVVTSALHASSGATSFTFRGTIVQTGQKPIILNLSVSSAKTAQGSVGINGQTIHIIRTGNTVYFSGDKAFWTANGGPAAAQLFDGKWVYGPATSSDFSAFSQFLDPHQITKQFFGTPPTGSTFKKSGTTTIAGQKVVVITAAKPSTGSAGSLYVATTGKPYVVRVAINSTTSGTGSITFLRYDKPVRTKAPKGAVSLSELQNAGN